MNIKMTYSLDGYHLTEQFETCVLVAYQKKVGNKLDVPTIGWGHTRSVTMGMSCTQTEADAWLHEDIAFAEDCVNRDVHVPLTQHEFDALVDFVFNCGVAGFEHSTLLKFLNNRQYEEAAKQLERWDMSGGQHLAGLMRRRLAEEALFNNHN